LASVREELAKGWLMVPGPCDCDGNVLMVFRGLHVDYLNADIDAMIRCMVYVLERLTADEQTCTLGLTFVMSMEGFRLSHLTPSFMGFFKRFVGVLEGRYPLRLRHSVIYKPPGVFAVAWRAGKPFLSKVLAEKLCLCSDEEALKRMLVKGDETLPAGGGELPAAMPEELGGKRTPEEIAKAFVEWCEANPEAEK